MVRIEKLIPDDLLKSLRIYLKAAAGNHGRFLSDRRGPGGLVIRNDPIMVMVHQDLLPIAEMIFRIPLRRSYCLTWIYGEKGVLPEHTDGSHTFGFEVCIDNTAPEKPWKRYVGNEGYLLGPGEGMVHDGGESGPRRQAGPEPGQEITIAGFYFVDKNFNLSQ